MKLNVGCGRDIKPGHINIDMAKLPGVDVVCNLEEPLPFKNNHFDYVYCKSVLEHIQNYLQIMEEFHRITKPQGVIHLDVPHCTSILAYTDPTHKRFFGYDSMRYFAKGDEYDFYTSASFRILSRKLIFTCGRFKLLNFIVDPVVNLFPNLYERMFMWYLPVETIIFKLQPLK